jgi:ribosomal protein S18 acetylase RimI-like enzyme
MGVASAMLWNGMQNLRDQGMTEVVLGVDAENPHNALRLYESVGFKVINKDALYQKPI